MLSIVLVTTVLAAGALAAGIDPQCQALIDAHSQMLDRIRTIEVQYTVDFIDGTDFKAASTWWSRDGRRERIRRVAPSIGPTSDGRPRGISDLLMDGATYKSLRNWDPENPQKITPSRQGTVRAFVAAQTNTNVGVLAPSQQLLFEVDDRPRRTLAELASVSPRVTYKAKVEVDGRELCLISLETPEETTATTTKRYFDVYLDPRAGYMIRKLVVNAPRIMRSNGEIGKNYHVHEVVEVKEFGDGIFMPIRIRIGTADEWVTEFAVKSVKINEPIADETFEMRWPKYAVVVHQSLGGGLAKAELWGDGEVLREIGEETDLKDLEAELRKDPVIAAELGPDPGVRPPVGVSTMLKLTIVLCTLMVLVFAIIFARRIREQAA